MPGKRYGIYESVGSTREPVTDYDDLSNHHPSKKSKEPGRSYETVDGRMEEVVTRDGHTMVSKDFVLFDRAGARSPADVQDDDKRVPVPAPFSGVVEVNERSALVIIRDPVTREPLAQIRHMEGVLFQTGDTVRYGEPLGTQSNRNTVPIHTHMDVNTKYLDQFDQYLKDISSGAITTEGYGPDQARLFIDQLSPQLAQRGMSEAQIETLAAAAARQQQRFAGQGEVQAFHLSKDGATVAFRQAFPPVREFNVTQALDSGAKPLAAEAPATPAEQPQRAARAMG
jgi:hypothetical protein